MSLPKVRTIVLPLSITTTDTHCGACQSGRGRICLRFSGEGWDALRARVGEGYVRIDACRQSEVKQ